MSTNVTSPNAVKAITYEMLYDLMRAEKNSAKLQSLKPGFYDDCRSYFNDKKEVLNKSSENKFAQKDFLLIQEQLKNVKMLLENLYSLRMRKIVSLAIDKAKLNAIVIDSSPMLDHEKRLFEEMLQMIEKHKEITILPVFDMSLAMPERQQESKPERREDVVQKYTYEELSRNNVKSERSDLNEKYEEPLKDTKQSGMMPKDIKPSPVPDAKSSDTGKDETNKDLKNNFRKIEFIQAISRFYDSELNSYGPFEPGNNAELPEKIVQILIGKGAVKILN